MASARVLEEREVIDLLKYDVSKAQNIIGLPVTTLQVLLDTFRWDTQALLDSYFTNIEQTFGKAKCIHPESIKVEESVPVVTCGICYDDLDKKGLTHATCGHVFCRTCWKDYLKQSIIDEGNSLRLECPMLNCSALLGDNFIVEICNKNYQYIIEGYWSLLAKAYVDKKESLSKCPAADCRNTLMREVTRASNVKCSCGQEFCFDCGRPNHYTVPCMLIGEWQAQAFKEDVKFSFVIVMTKKCPKCKTDIEKDGGCPHMHCSRCKSDFCWKCLLPYKNHKQCREEEEVVGDKREIEAEVNDGMSEKERFRCFQETFEKCKAHIGYLIQDKKAQASLWSILASEGGAPNKILIKKLPIQTNMEDRELKQGKRKSNVLDLEPSSKRNNIEEETRSGTMGTFIIAATAGPSNISQNDASLINDDGYNDTEEVFHGDRDTLELHTQGRTFKNSYKVFLNMRDIVTAMKSEMVKTTDLGWFPTDHLSKASSMLEETQRVLMYSQVFAFYVGCQPPQRISPTWFNRTASVNVLSRALSTTDPKSFDADMFQNNLENLEKTLKCLSDSLLEVTISFLHIRSRIIVDEERKEKDLKQAFKDFLETMEKMKGEIMNNMAICGQRKDSVVSLMEDGFGERTWAFRTANI